MKQWSINLGGLLLGLAACGSPHGAAELARAAEKATADSLTQDFRAWYAYAYYQTPLGQPFTALDTSAHPLTRPAFLEKLRTGRFLALRLRQPAGSAMLTYKLYPLASTNPDIIATSRQLADIELDHYLLENKPLPAFDFRDLQGKHYTPASTRGKVLVLKTWYINCSACVAEFPEVNALADRYKANPNVVFVSLALDNADYLNAFLTRQQLHYAVVPKSEEYIRDELKTNSFPTHVVVDQHGKIVKVANRVADLATALTALVPPASPRPPETGAHP